MPSLRNVLPLLPLLTLPPTKPAPVSPEPAHEQDMSRMMDLCNSFADRTLMLGVFKKETVAAQDPSQTEALFAPLVQLYITGQEWCMNAITQQGSFSCEPAEEVGSVRCTHSPEAKAPSVPENIVVATTCKPQLMDLVATLEAFADSGRPYTPVLVENSSLNELMEAASVACAVYQQTSNGY